MLVEIVPEELNSLNFVNCSQNLAVIEKLIINTTKVDVTFIIYYVGRLSKCMGFSVLITFTCSSNLRVQKRFFRNCYYMCNMF